MTTKRNKPNILLIVMDTTRAKTVSMGIKEGFLPNLSHLSNEALYFKNCFSTAPWTLPSHASMFTGQYSSSHGVSASSTKFNPANDTLATRLKIEGYRTAAFSNNSWISTEFGFEKGFDNFNVRWKLSNKGANIGGIVRENSNNLNKLSSILNKVGVRDIVPTMVNAVYARYLQEYYDDGAFLTNWRLKRWLGKQRRKSSPFFAFVNYLEPHLKYNPPKSFANNHLPNGVDISDAMEINQDAWAYITGDKNMTENQFSILRHLYQAELAYLDHRIGNLIDYLKSENLFNNTIVVITADHGENIGEHDLMDHQYSLYDTLLHVPLLVRHPNGVQGEIDSSMVELRDLYPTLIEFSNGSIPDDSTISENSLTGIIRGRNKDSREFILSEYLTPQPKVEDLYDKYSVNYDINKYNQSLRAIRTTKWKYIEKSNGNEELYDLSIDSEETQNIASKEPETVSKLSECLKTKLGEFDKLQMKTENKMSSSTKERLEKLGYI